MTAPRNDKAGVEPGNVCAQEIERTAILPERPAADNCPTFVVEQMPTPLREPAHIAQVLIRFDAREPLPAGAMSRVLAMICEARRKAMIAHAMPRGARVFWGGFTDDE